MTKEQAIKNVCLYILTLPTDNETKNDLVHRLTVFEIDVSDVDMFKELVKWCTQEE